MTSGRFLISVLSKRLVLGQTFIQQAISAVLLPEDTLSPSAQLLMQQLFPDMDWDNTKIHLRLPWFLFGKFKVNGIVLPGYSWNRVHIYLNRPALENADDISLLAHECYHARQYQSFNKNRGPFFLKGFLLHYLSWWFKTGYYRHPFEVPAFQLDGDLCDLLDELEEEGLGMDWSESHLSANETAQIAERLKERLGQPEVVAPRDHHPVRLSASMAMLFLISVLKPLLELLLWIPLLTALILLRALSVLIPSKGSQRVSR